MTKDEMERLEVDGYIAGVQRLHQFSDEPEREDMPFIGEYMGKDLRDLTRRELIDALVEAHRQLDDANGRHMRTLEIFGNRRRVG